jgi:hypothetical protein
MPASRLPPFKLLLVRHALDRAWDRLQDGLRSRDPLETFAPLGESLWWLVVTDELLEDHIGRESYLAKRDASTEGRLLKGIRYVRNRVGHDHDLYRLVYLVTGANLPINLPMSFHEWRWRPSSELPALTEKWHRRGEEVYEAEMAGRPAHIAIEAGRRFVVQHAFGWDDDS